MVTARSDTDVQPIVTTSTTTEPPPTVTKTTQTRVGCIELLDS